MQARLATQKSEQPAPHTGKFTFGLSLLGSGTVEILRLIVLIGTPASLYLLSAFSIADNATQEFCDPCMF